MIGDLLGVLAQNPRAVIPEVQVLKLITAAEFDHLVTADILVPTDAWAAWILLHGRLLTVEELADSSFVAFDPDDPEFDDVPLQESDIAEWQFDIEKLAQRVATGQGIEPRVEQVTERSWLIGRLRRDLPLAITLLADEREAGAELLQLRARLPLAVQGLVAALPEQVAPSNELRVVAERHNIALTALLPSLDLRPSPLGLALQILASEPPGTLDPESGFLLAHDLRTAVLGHFRFRFSAMEGAVVHYLLRSLLNGLPLQHQSTILTEVGSRSKDLESVCGRNPAWGDLIVGDGDGNYRLDFSAYH